MEDNGAQFQILHYQKAVIIHIGTLTAAPRSSCSPTIQNPHHTYSKLTSQTPSLTTLHSISHPTGSSKFRRHTQEVQRGRFSKSTADKVDGGNSGVHTRKKAKKTFRVGPKKSKKDEDEVQNQHQYGNPNIPIQKNANDGSDGNNAKAGNDGNSSPSANNNRGDAPSSTPWYYSYIGSILLLLLALLMARLM